MQAGTGMALGKLLLPREAVCSEARAPTCGGAVATRTHRRLLPLNLQDRLPAGRVSSLSLAAQRVGLLSHLSEERAERLRGQFLRVAK